MPAWWWSWFYQSKKPRQKPLASSMQPKRRGKCGWYFRVLKWYLRQNKLCSTVWDSYDEIIEACNTNRPID